MRTLGEGAEANACRNKRQQLDRHFGPSNEAPDAQAMKARTYHFIAALFNPLH